MVKNQIANLIPKHLFGHNLNLKSSFSISTFQDLFNGLNKTNLKFVYYLYFCPQNFKTLWISNSHIVGKQVGNVRIHSPTLWKCVWVLGHFVNHSSFHTFALIKSPRLSPDNWNPQQHKSCKTLTMWPTTFLKIPKQRGTTSKGSSPNCNGKRGIFLVLPSSF